MLAGIFFWPILFGNAILTGYDTFTIFYPLRSAVSAALLNGRLPLWNPSPFLGTPLLANPQVAALYPVNLPFYFLPTGPSLAWTMVAHIFLAATFMYGFMRIETGVGRAPAWLAGALFAWGGFMGQQTGHINQVSVAAWLPLLLLLGGRTWRSPTRRRIAALAVAVALQLLAGHSQESYMNLAALAAYVTFLTVHRYGWRRFLSGRRSVLAVAAAVALGVALAAVQLVPTLELTRLSIRSGGLTFRTASSFSLQPADLLSALLPNYGGPPPIETAAYAGVTGLLLAIIGLLFYQRRPPARFAALLGTVALLLALGRYSPLYWVAYYVVPGVGLFRAPARWLMLFSCRRRHAGRHGPRRAAGTQLARPAAPCSRRHCCVPHGRICHCRRGAGASPHAGRMGRGRLGSRGHALPCCPGRRRSGAPPGAVHRRAGVDVHP